MTITNHPFPEAPFTELAGGGGSPATMRRLGDAQRSKHLMLLHAIAEAATGPRSRAGPSCNALNTLASAPVSPEASAGHARRINEELTEVAAGRSPPDFSVHDPGTLIRLEAQMKSPDPYMYIGSSTEGLPIARALQAELDEECEPLVWEQDFFVPTGTTIGTLAEKVQNFDFAAFIFTPDDSLIIRGSTNATARDNVILELGIFIGALGKERVFIIRPRDQELHLPSDLADCTCLTYRSNRKDQNLRAAIGPAATAIRNRIIDLGIRRTLD